MSLMFDAAGDIAAFVAAQDELRSNFGSVVTMHVPQSPTWPPGTRINPDTDEPYDALAQPTSPPFADVVVTALLITRQASTMRAQAETAWAAPGLMESGEMTLDVSTEDYELVKDATEFTATARRFTVQGARPYELGGVTYRHLIYGAEL